MSNYVSPYIIEAARRIGLESRSAAPSLEEVTKRIHADDVEYITDRMANDGWQLVKMRSEGPFQKTLTFQREAEGGSK